MTMPERVKDERGAAMIIAISVVVICATLSVAALARTSNGLKSSRQNQDFAGALANADAGVSDALFRIDQMGTGAVTEFCVGASATCTVNAVPGNDGVEYSVERVDDYTVIVRSKGVAEGVEHTVEVEFARNRQFPFGVFAAGDVLFQGNVNGPACTQAQMPCAGVYPVDSSYPAQYNTTLDADAGSATLVSCSGGNPADNHVVNPGGQVTGCPNPVYSSTVYNPLDPISGPCPAAVNSPETPCLGEVATYTSWNATQCSSVSGPITPGRYLCATDLVFTGNTSVGAGSANGGAVEFFVIPPSGTADVVFANVEVNEGVIGDPTKGDPTKFRINLAKAGEIDGGNGNNAKRFTGILYAPNATMTNNGCKIEIRGALVLGAYRCNGAPNLQIQYDVRVNNLQQSDWEQMNYQEIPSKDFVLP